MPSSFDSGSPSPLPEPILPEQIPPDPMVPEPRRTFPWFWLGTLVGTVLSATGLGLGTWAWIFIQDDLSPLLSKLLTESLERPVALGEVEKVSLGSLQVGPSEMGASTTDFTTVTADTVIIKFDLVKTLLTSRLNLDLVLVDAKGYLEQDQDNGWLDFRVPEQDEEEDQRFEVRLDEIQVRDSQITLVPLPTESGVLKPIVINQLQGNVNFDELRFEDQKARTTQFEVSGKPSAGGDLTVAGKVEPVALVGDNLKLATNLSIRGNQAPLRDVLAFTLSTVGLQTEAIAVESGQVSGSLDLAIRPQQPVDYRGVLSVDNGSIRADALPLPLQNLQGQTRFQGSRWMIDQLSGVYGEIAAVAEGLVDFDRGYDLAVTADEVTVDAFTQTLKLDLPVPTTGQFRATAQVTGPLRQPQVLGTAVAIAPLNVDRLTFTSARTDFLYTERQLLLSDMAAVPSTGGSLGGSGALLIGEGTPFSFQIAGRNLPATAIANLYNINPNFALGLVAADATVTGRSGRVSTTIEWNAPTAQYPGSGVIDINGEVIAFRDTLFQIGGGTVTGSGTLTGQLWEGAINLAKVQLGVFSEALRGDVSGQFQVSGNTADTRIGAIAARGNVAFSAGVAAFSRQFDSFNSPLTAQVAWNGEKIEIIQAESQRITASGTLTPTFEDGFTGLERFDLNLSARDYALTDLPFALPSVIALAGRTDFSGTLTGSPIAPNLVGNLQLADLVVNRLPFNSQLTGTIDYSQRAGLALNVAGGRDKIVLNTGSLGPFADAAAGRSNIPDLDFDIGWRDAFASGQTEGDLLRVQAGNFPLSALNFPPNGAADIGQLRGTLSTNDLAVNLANQTFEGDLKVARLGLGYIGAAQLEGRVRYANQLVTLTNGELFLNGNQAAASDGEAFQGNRLGPSAQTPGDFYTLSGRLALNGPVPVYSASLATQSGNIQNLLTAFSIYRLEDFQRGLTPPDWAPNSLSPDQLNRVLATTPAGCTDSASADQLPLIDPLARPITVDIETCRRDSALLEQLRRLAEIQAIQERIELARADDPVPPLNELQGLFAGDLQLSGSGSDFQLDFDLAGANWQWGPDYSAEDVIAKGSLTPGVLTLEPVRLASVIAVPTGAVPTSPPAVPNTVSDVIEMDGSGSTSADQDRVESAIAVIDLAGQLVFGRNTELGSNLQATAQNLDAAALGDILQLPLDIDGLANARATLSGTLTNPQIRGSAALATATINETPIQSATAQFLYQNARLTINSELVASTPDHPLTLQAQIPWAFGFMTAQPESDQIAVNINVEDEGLSLLNIFTQQVAWESGQGQVNLTVSGTLKNPEIAGIATLDGAVLNAKILPEPLTNVTGSATFVGDQIVVQSLSGQFSDGQLTAAGTFPLLNPIISGGALSTLTSTQDPNADPLFPQPLAPNRPLTVNFQNVALDLEKLYSGGVNGQIIVGGSALLSGPKIGGEVILSNGQVLLANGTNDPVTPDDPLEFGTLATPSATQLPQLPQPAGGITPEFRDLRLTLGRNVRVVRGNLLNFVADGTLLLNGFASALEPDGTINLRSGRVSLYTTLFSLRGSNNTAQFTPELGLQNPFLNVSLRATVPEVNRSGTLATTPFANAEIADTSNSGFDNLGSLQTIRVRATVNGPANDIVDNLELSSSPPRNESELLALIGDSYISALESTVGSLAGGGDNFGGLINLVSGTLLTSLQDIIGNALSLSEFRLFPVTAASRRSTTAANVDNGLDIGAYIGFDFTEDASASVSKILTDSSNPEFGLSYRLTDALTVRSATNFDDINQVLLEYEIRF